MWSNPREIQKRHILRASSTAIEVKLKAAGLMMMPAPKSIASWIVGDVDGAGDNLSPTPVVRPWTPKPVGIPARPDQLHVLGLLDFRSRLDDLEPRPYKEPIPAELRERLIIDAAAAVMNIFRYFKAGSTASELSIFDSLTHRRSEPKVGRNEPCPCGSGKKYKLCCGRVTFH
jgi:hypothetical protein